MEYIDARVNQLFIENDSKHRSIIKTFSAKPSRKKAAEFGSLFGLVEIESGPKTTEVVNFIIEELKREYFPSEENYIDSTSVHFETTLKKLNLALASFIEQQHITLDLSKLNIIICLSYKNEIHLSTVGRSEAILFYRLTSGKYKIINIFDSAKVATEEPNPLKLFSQIISGRIRNNDILFISTANVLDYFSLEKIKKTITEEPTLGEGLSALRELIDQTNSRENFGIIGMEVRKVAVAENVIIQKSSNEDIIVSGFQRAASKDSINTLMKTERDTEKLLSPTLTPEVKKYISTFKEMLRNYLLKTKSLSSELYQRNKLKLKKPEFKTPFKLPGVKIPQFKIPPVVKDSYSNLKNSRLTNNSRYQKILGNFKKNLSGVINFLQNIPLLSYISKILRPLWQTIALRYEKLPRSSKYLLIVTTLLGVLFSSSIIWIRYNAAVTERTEKINSILVDAEGKKNVAESSLIYRDENQARLLLLEAKELLQSVEKPSEEQLQRIQKLSDELDRKLYELRHETVFNDPTQIINIKNLDIDAELSGMLIYENNRVTVHNINNGNVTAVSIQNLENETVAEVQQHFIAGAAITTNEIALITNSNELYLYNLNTRTATKAQINIPENSSITDIGVFNGRIYLLDKETGQVYRYARLGTNKFGSGTKWIEEGEQKANSVSLSIDGSIYVLNNGMVNKYVDGNLTEYSLKTIEPVLGGPTKIKTDAFSNFLYILDPPTNRLIVIDKESGNIVAQYVSDKFINLKDFVVRPQQKDILILADTTVFAIPASHL